MEVFDQDQKGRSGARPPQESGDRGVRLKTRLVRCQLGIEHPRRGPASDSGADGDARGDGPQVSRERNGIEDRTVRAVDVDDGPDNLGPRPVWRGSPVFRATRPVDLKRGGFGKSRELLECPRLPDAALSADKSHAAAAGNHLP